MTASRWDPSLLDLTEWLSSQFSSSEDIAYKPVIKHILKSEDENNDDLDTHSEKQNIPTEIPILPLRGVVVYPQTAVPLTVGKKQSIQLVDDVLDGDKIIGLISAINPDIEKPGPDDLHSIGTVAIIHRLFRAPDNTIRLLVQGLERFKVTEYTELTPYLKARIELLPETVEDGLEVEALTRNTRDQFNKISKLLPSLPRELIGSMDEINDPLQMVYTIANFHRMGLDKAQEILEQDSTIEKLRSLVASMAHEIEILEIGQKIQNEARSEIEKVQREYFLREQLKAIQRELGDADEHTADMDEFRQKIDSAGLSPEAEKQARHELDRLSRLPTAAAEYGVIRTYLDWLVSLPWSATSEDRLDIDHARKVLDEDHHSLKDVKDRILEYLAVRKLRGERKEELENAQPLDSIRRIREGVVLCFVGPPGVGKTSLGRSIARAMEREFIHISLGGIRDEAEIRGHRRTYIGALPGRILQAIRRAETKNPIFMLDEVDKLSFDFRGDPASALLEVLDPEQNNEFRDHYLEVAFDLSQVMFITTANMLEPIPSPLKDRMEIIHISGYTDGEKMEIAKSYLIPRQILENGLKPDEICFEDNAVQRIIRRYTREAGVRNLEREIGTVCRKIVTQVAEGKKEQTVITKENLSEFLDHERFHAMDEAITRIVQPGVAAGLAWTPFGGEVLFIEATRMNGNKGFLMTGSVGDVMQESAQAALSYVRSRAEQYGLEPDFYEKSDIHVHIPAGAQPKDGPSAGITLAIALISLISNKPVSPDIGMTGEITLMGQVLPIGGLKEKILAAHRYGLKRVILSKLNESDLSEIPDEIRKTIDIILVDNIDEALQIALQPYNASKPKKNKRKKE